MSGIEFYNTSALYAETFTSFGQITYNLVHKLGIIYDAIYFLIVHHGNYAEQVTQGALDEWFMKLGLYYGTIIFYAFYTPEDFQVYDPLEDDYGTNRDYDVDDLVA